MRLKILLPTEVLLDQEVGKVLAEGDNGWFCLLPNHQGFVSALVPGILLYTLPDGTERVLAVDEGLLVKCGPEVLVSVREAVQGTNLGSLQRAVEEQFARLDEQEKKARAAAAKLELDLVRRFVQLREYGR